MEKKCFFTHANGMDFYCELRGTGSLLVIIPCGCNDCGAYDTLSECLKKDFTVLSFDPRGGSRSPDPHPAPVYPKTLADDAAAIMKELGYEKASFYGCSSGGQGVLAMALYHPEMCVNVMVHEAALQADAPLPMAGMRYFQQVSTYQPYCNGFSAGDIGSVADYNKYMELDPITRARMAKNPEYWVKWYVGTVDMVHYTDEELKRMKNIDFTTGCWSAAWCVAANIDTARRGNFPHRWLMSSHQPHITCPEELADYIRETCAKYR